MLIINQGKCCAQESKVWAKFNTINLEIPMHRCFRVFGVGLKSRKDLHAGDLGTPLCFAFIRSQRVGKVCVGSADGKTKYECKLRHYSVKLKFSATRREIVDS